MTTILNRQVATGGDDGFTNLGLGFDNSVAYGPAFGNFGGNGVNGFARFTNITIPQGATIVSAQITFQAQASQSGAPCTTKIFCNAVDNASAPTTSTDHNNKVRTSAFTSWAAASQSAGSNYATPDFATAVQEVINRPGWTLNNALMVLIDNDGSASGAYRLEDSYDGDAPNAALLTITYAENGSDQFVLSAL